MTQPEHFTPQNEDIMSNAPESFMGRFREALTRDDGIIGGAFVGKIALIGILGGGAAGVAFWHDNIGIETRESVIAGVGTLKSVYVMRKDECHGGYVSTAPSKAELNKVAKFLGVKVATTYRASEAFHGDVTNDVCNTGINAEMEIDKKTHKTTVTIPAEALHTKVYQTNPLDANAWTSDNGAAVALIKNFGNDIKVLPGGLDVKAGDALQAKLRGEALLGAFELSSKACGVKAWDHLRDAYAEEIKKDIVADNNKFSDIQITEADVTVNLPKTVAFDNQYDEMYKTMFAAAKKKGVVITLTDPAKMVCRDTGNITVQTKAPSSGANK